MCLMNSRMQPAFCHQIMFDEKTQDTSWFGSRQLLLVFLSLLYTDCWLWPVGNSSDCEFGSDRISITADIKECVVDAKDSNDVGSWWLLVLFRFQCNLLTANMKFHADAEIPSIDYFSKCILLVFEMTVRLALEGMGSLNVFCQRYIGIIETKSIVNGIVKSYVFVLWMGWSWIASNTLNNNNINKHSMTFYVGRQQVFLNCPHFPLPLGVWFMWAPPVLLRWSI